jgi:hypothetical protein
MAKVLEFPADRITKGIHAFTPEMGQRKPNCQLKATLSHTGKYRVVSPIELQGRGIKHYQSEGNRHIYYLTDLAFDKLKTQYSVSMERLLD